MEHKPGNSSPALQAAEQYLSAKPIASQFGGWRQDAADGVARHS